MEIRPLKLQGTMAIELSLETSWGETGAVHDDLDGFLAGMLQTLAAERDG